MVMKIGGEIKQFGRDVEWPSAWYRSYRTYTTYMIRLPERPNQFPEGGDGVDKLW
jgi:hypothetical protein